MVDPLPDAPPRLLRDQRRAAIAYRCVAEVVSASAEQPPRGVAPKEYKNAVLAIGVDIRRMGLSGALASVQRDKAGERLLADLREAPFHQAPPEGLALPAWVRGLGLVEYMVVTRELLQHVVWLRRAVQAQIQGV